MNRRDFMRWSALAGGCLALPRTLSAASDAPPKRLIYVLSNLGPEIKSFRMKPQGAPDSLLAKSSYDPKYDGQPDEATWEIDLKTHPPELWSYALAPLQKVKDYVIALDGLYLATADLDSFGDGHAQAWLAASTGAPAAGENIFPTGERSSYASEPSIDMRVAAFLRTQAPHIRDMVMPLRIAKKYSLGPSEDNEHFHYYVYDRAAPGSNTMVRVAQWRDPAAVWDRLFSSATTPAQNSDALAQARAKVLADLAQRYKDLRGQLAGYDAEKIEHHHHSLESVIARLNDFDPPTAECSPPTKIQSGQFKTQAQIYEHIVNTFKEMIPASFVCDTTRVFSVEIIPPPASLIGGSDNYDYHDHYSHNSDPRAEFASKDSNRYQQWLETQPVQAAKTRYHAQFVADLAERLYNTRESDGSRMLDHTLIVWVDEVSHGNHGHDQWPAVLVGGSWAFRTGRYIRFARTNNKLAEQVYGGIHHVGQPHTPMLVSICQAMGLPLDNLVTNLQLNSPLPLTGPLAALY